MPYEKNPLERGALWEKTSARGTYFTGNIDGEPCVVFKNEKKAPGSKGPDWRVMKPKPKPETEGPRDLTPQPDDDIPF